MPEKLFAGGWVGSEGDGEGEPEDEPEDEEMPEEDEETYSGEGKKELQDEDELTDVDEGLMQGYEEGEKLAKCSYCKKVIEADFVETEIDGEIYRFCSDDHVEKFKKKKEEEI